MSMNIDTKGYSEMTLEKLIESEYTAWREAELIDVYVFKIRPVAKGRPRAIVMYRQVGGGCRECKRGSAPYAILQTPEETREFEQAIAAATAQMVARTPAHGERIGMRPVFINDTVRGDLSNFWKAVEDAMQEHAFKNDGLIDYAEPLRIVTDSHEPQIQVAIIRKKSNASL